MGDAAAHAKLPPSGASRWGPDGCQASAQMEAQYPEDTESPEAIEGTAAHHYVSEMLLGRPVKIGDITPNGHPVTKEMIDCGEDYLRDIRSVVACSPGADALRVENRVSAVQSVHPENWGTPDAYLMVRGLRKLFLWDYKYGHRYVDAYGNWQCVNYAAAILESEGIPQADWSSWTLVVTIAQPRNYHPDGPLREWHFGGVELVERVARLRAAAAGATVEQPTLKTGDHCRDCNARHACPALERVSMGLVDMSMTGQPIDLPPAALGLELAVITAAIARLKARATGLEEQALALAKRGTQIPHWRAEYSYGRKRWIENISVAELITLGRIYGVDPLKAPQAITPTQLIKAGVDAEVVDAYAHTPRGAMTLVPFNDVDIAKRFG